MATWHFADTAYNPENITLPISTRVPGEDVMWALQGCMETFSSVAKNPASSPWIWSFQLRALIHFVGDVHQPLHNGQLFDHQFPNGDEGGNLFIMQTPLQNLHFIWDSAGGLYQVEPPLSTAQANELSKNATELMQLHPRDSLQTELSKGLNFTAWHDEAFNLMATVAYAGVQYNTVPTAEYLNTVQSVSKRQLALAGYRLADALNTVMSNGNVPTAPVGGNTTLVALSIIIAVLAVAGVALTALLLREKRKRTLKSPNLKTNEERPLMP
mmetsp:Transcript_23013/g.58358  ORF Transcript_23013/g.58358 Transcript_23013/m.58358 type:complete len:270 (-) Transcript_23013:367-1176(-)